jgi:hypothetical protein
LFSITKPANEQLALVLGSSGALGSAIVSHLQKSSSDVTIIGADIKMNDKVNVDAFIYLKGVSINAISSELENSFHDLFESKPEFDEITLNMCKWWLCNGHRCPVRENDGNEL